MKRVFFLLLLSISFIEPQASLAAAAATEETKQRLTRRSPIGDHDITKMVGFQSGPATAKQCRTMLAELSSFDESTFDWGNLQTRENFSLLVSITSVAANNLCEMVFRSVRVSNFPTVYDQGVAPVIGYLQQRLFNPSIRALKERGVIPADSRFGIIPDLSASCAYLEDTNDNYIIQVIPSSLNKKNKTFL